VDSTDLRPAPPAPVPTYTLSSSDSLLREFEQIIGWTIIKSEDIVSLVCNSNESIVVKLRRSGDDDGCYELLENGYDESILTFMKTFNSIPGLIGKLTINEVTRMVMATPPS
jgi:hypothetical protein